MCLEQEQWEHKPRSKNNENTNPDLPCQPNTKATNTNTAIDLPYQPNRKATNTNPTKNTQTQRKMALDYYL